MSYVMIGNWYIIRFILIFTILFPNLNRYISICFSPSRTHVIGNNWREVYYYLWSKISKP